MMANQYRRNMPGGQSHQLHRNEIDEVLLNSSLAIAEEPFRYHNLYEP